MDDALKLVKKQLAESTRVKGQMAEMCSEDILRAAQLITEALKKGNKVLWCGNGGSAADSQHLSTELLARLRRNRMPLSSVALTTDTSFLTAWSNDVSFDTVFSRQVEGLGRKGDILVAISTSGNSVNVVQAVDTARKKGMKTVIFTGKDGGSLDGRGDLILKIPSDDTQHVQEGHITAGHIICDLVERVFL